MIKKGKRQAIHRNIFAIHTSDRELVFKMHKDLQFNKKNVDNQFFKNGQNIFNMCFKKGY